MHNPAHVQSLIDAMLKKTLYVVLRAPADTSRLSELLEVHFDWAIRCEKAGQLFASGPFVDESAPPGSLGGLSIVRADTVQEAQDIIQGDPLIKNGVYTATIRKWIVMEGGFQVSVQFSDQTYSLQ